MPVRLDKPCVETKGLGYRLEFISVLMQFRSRFHMLRGQHSGQFRGLNSKVKVKLYMRLLLDRILSFCF
jgi:hypothetical protein